VGITQEPLGLLYTPTAVMIGMVYEFLPFMVLPAVYVAREDRERSTGGRGGPWRTAMAGVPESHPALSVPGMIAGTILVFIPAMGMFVLPDLMGGAKTLLIGNVIRNQFLTARDWPFGAAASMILMLMTLLLTLYYTRRAASQRSCWYEREEAASLAATLRPGGVRLHLRAHIDPDDLLVQHHEVEYPMGRFHNTVVRVLFSDQQVILATRNTLIIAVVSTVVATILGTMAALALHRYRFPGYNASETMMYIPIVIPEVIMGISMLVLFVMLNFTLGLATITLAHIAFNIPFVALVVRARLHGYDNAIDEAAMDLGANELTTFWRVTLPTIMPACCRAPCWRSRFRSMTT